MRCCYVCERIALRPESLTLGDLTTLASGAALVGDAHVAEVASDEYLRRTRATAASTPGGAA